MGPRGPSGPSGKSGSDVSFDAPSLYATISCNNAIKFTLLLYFYFFNYLSTALLTLNSVHHQGALSVPSW